VCSSDLSLFTDQSELLKTSLNKLREGMFAKENRGRMDLITTDEGYPLSQNLLKNGYMTETELNAFPAADVKKVGVHPIIECTQNIPCNPCQDACAFGCIKVDQKITRLPEVDATATCVGCGMCVASCSGQAIFLVDEDYNSESASVSLPYEFLPLPRVGDKGSALDRSGSEVCVAQVVKVQKSDAMDETAVLTIIVPKGMETKARFFKEEA